MGLSMVRNAPAAASDVHRLASRLVMLAVVAVAVVVTAFTIPSGADSVQNVASMLDTLRPVH
jgi:hypothetical protein